MDFLVDNPIANIYGPYFLIFYAAFIIFVITVLVIAKKSLDGTDKIPLPIIPNEIDPYEIAYLRGDRQELARSLIFGLVQKGYLEFDDSNTKIIRLNKNGNLKRLSRIEEVTLDWFGTQRTTSDVFASNGLVTQIESYSQTYKNRLEKQNLLVTNDIKRRYTILQLVASLAIVSLGLYKIMVAILNARTNFIFLIVLGVIGLIVVFMTSVFPRVSKLGEKYLYRLQLTFEDLKNRTQKAYIANPEAASSQKLAGVDPMLLSVGLFGGTVLAGTAFGFYNDAFKKSANSHGACGAGCGMCSNDSGSSCSSCSSGCGGGCGGCGGCGG